LPPDLAGRLAVVTGAAHGIGLAIARRLAASGARVLAVDKDEARLEQEFGDGPCVAVVGDLSRDTRQLAERLVREHGPVELIVNNVGIATPHSYLELEEAEFDKVLDTNFRGPWFFTKRLVEELIAAGRPGSILFLSSLHDRFVMLRPHYSASKAAVAMLGKELAFELAARSIRVNVLSPGWVFRPQRPGDRPNPELVRLIPKGRTQDDDEIARMAIILLSDAWSGQITGQNVQVDGGLSMLTWSSELRRPR
jgi:3-oxoacyl-[acyl-carrier protein] reductase